jgi:hypothetical protein
MKIYLASYQALCLHQGGPTYKLEHTKQALKELGYDVRYFDMWDRKNVPTKNDLVHIFNASVSTYALAKNLKNLGVKYLVNPIYFSNHSLKKSVF